MQIKRFRVQPHFLWQKPAALLALCVVAACGSKEPGSTQTAARVNKEEITVHQIGALVAQQPVPPEQTAAAERQALERLINRELAVQKAIDLKLDREPRVVQAIESSRREIIARAYAEKLSEGAARPTAAEIKKYYDDHPALFRERKVYQLQEFVIQAEPAQLEALRGGLDAVKSPDELAAHLKSHGAKFAANQAVRAAEQLPLSLLPSLARLKDGQALLTQTPKGGLIILVRATRPQPVDEERARPAIEQFLLNEQKRKLLSDDLKALRAAAKVEYQGRFAASAPLPAEPAPTAADVAASAAAGLRAAGEPAEAPVAASAPPDSAVKAASGIDASTVNKGLGLK